MQSILKSIPSQVAVAAFVRDLEANRIYNGPEEDVMKETELINLQPFIYSQLLQIVPLENGPEANTAVNFSSAVAIAVHRLWSLATDDKAAISFFRREVPQLHILSTPEILKHWVDTTHPQLNVISIMLRNIGNRARYEPHIKHHLYDWWQAYREEKS